MTHQCLADATPLILVDHDKGDLSLPFTDQEAAFFVNVDFVNQVALIALMDEDGRSVIAGCGRYIVVQPKLRFKPKKRR